MSDQEKIEKTIAVVREELERAMFIHKPMTSVHEGFAVLLEEVDELWAEIKLKELNLNAVHKEAKQVAAMAIRLMVDVCEKDS